MNTMFRRLILPCAMWIGMGLFVSASGYETRYVHVLVIDGARYSETFGDPLHQYIPQMWNKLRPLGTIYTRCYNDGITYTTPGHISIVTGMWHGIQNDGAVQPAEPTVFEYFRRETAAPANSAFVILGKDKLYTLAAGTHPDYGSAFGASIRYATPPYDDTLTWKNLRDVLRTHHPRLTITNLAQVDVWGHTGIWEEYVRSIRLADSIVYATWNLIQSDPVYKDKTTLIVTNDHGRHNDECWYDHGDACDGCRHLMLLMIGPDTRPEVVDTTRRTLIDIAPTIGELLDFSMPYCKGTPLVPVQPPATPQPLAPANRSIHQPLTMSLQWLNVGRASFYHVQLGTDSTFGSLYAEDSLLTMTSWPIGSLDINTVYFWRIRARNSVGTSAWSAPQRFVTVPIMPPIVVLNAPEHSKILTSDTVHFSWNATTSDADRFELVVALDSLMTRPVFSDSQLSGTVHVHHFSRNKTEFWWHVRAHYHYGWAPWSPTRRFAVDVPVIITPPTHYTMTVTMRRNKSLPLRVSYTIPSPSAVTLRLFTLNGQYRRTLINEWLSAGSYNNDMVIATLSHGCYLLDFQAGPYRATRVLTAP